MTKKQTVRNSIYKPTLDKENHLDVAVALGINAFEDKAKILFDESELATNNLVFDTLDLKLVALEFSVISGDVLKQSIC